MGSLMLFSFVGLTALGIPIAYVLLGTTVISMWFGTTQAMTTVAQQFFTGIDSFPLLAIPLFMIAGSLMAEADISKRLTDFSNAMVGHYTGGLAFVAVLSCMIFAAISGSGPATVAALGGIMIPGMVREGYDKGFASALMAVAGAIGVIIPPSIPMVVYSTTANVSTGDMFLAGFSPGIVIGSSLMAYSYYTAKKYGYGTKKEKPDAKTRWAAFKSAFLSLLMPVIILGGIYGGIFTPTEAAAVACFYGLFIGVFVYKKLNLNSIKKVLLDAASSTAMVMLIIGAAKGFGWLLTAQRIPDAVGSFLISISSNKYILLALINFLLLIVGCFMECNAAILILTPIFLPVMVQLGVHPIHFGIIMVVNLAMGMSTPPLGVNLFVASGIAKIPLEPIIKKAIPLLGANLAALFLITNIESISMFLVRLFGV